MSVLPWQCWDGVDQETIVTPSFSHSLTGYLLCPRLCFNTQPLLSLCVHSLAGRRKELREPYKQRGTFASLLELSRAAEMPGGVKGTEEAQKANGSELKPTSYSVWRQRETEGRRHG